MNPTNWGAAAAAQREEMQRALTVSTAGSILVQTYVNRVVQALTLRYLGVWSTLDHKPGTGPAAVVNRRAPGTTDSQWLPDTTEPDEDTGTVTQVTFTYRTCIGRIKVTRKLQATGRSYADNLANETIEKLDDHMNTLENGAVVGNNAANANQISGLLTLIGGFSGQVVANTTATAGAALILAKLDETIDKVKGSDADKVIFASLKGRRLLNAALQAYQQFNDTQEIDGGFRVRSYDMIPIVPSTEIPDDLTWVASGVITVFSGGSTTALIVVNRRYVWFEDLTPTSILPLAKTTSQSDQLDLFTDTVLVTANTKGAAILGGLA